MSTACDPDVSLEYQCPYCDSWYERLNLGRVHPEYETLPCFDCAKKGVRQAPCSGPEYKARHDALTAPRKPPPISAKPRRWNQRNGGTGWYGEGTRSRI